MARSVVNGALVLAYLTAFAEGAQMQNAPAAKAAPDVSPAKNAQELARHTVTLASSRDGTPQRALFYVPPEAAAGQAGAPVPLLVALHTWSNGYAQSLEYLPFARERGWAMVAPDFRGPNSRPEACASDLAVQDVLDAVAYARKNARVDETRVYLLGVSGGGHMALMMAARAPDAWAGVSAWVPIADLAAWHAENAAAKRGYGAMLEKVCGGPPGQPNTDAEYRRRSPLFFLAAAKGLAIEINAGIHDGHTGSVPISHALRAFNVLAEANGLKQSQLASDEIEFMTREQRVPPALAREREDDPERKRAVLFRRVAGPVRVTIFEGGHDGEIPAALAWLARQRKGAAGAARAASDGGIAAKAAQLLDESLTLLAAKADDRDTQGYDRGVWRFRNCEKFWPVQGGPGTAAAVLWRWRARNVPPKDKAGQDKQAWLHHVAVETFDRALADHLKPEGYFDENATPATYFFAAELATACLELKGSLDEPTQARWRDALVKMVDYLVRSGNLPNAALPGWKATDGWYTNGNIELGEAELAYLVWKVTGEAKYKELFEVQWQHTLHPSPQRWPGFGLRITREPTREDGADGAGYLAESGGKEPGYDGDYAHFALTVASRLYVASRDPRVLRLMNLLLNTLLAHTDENWVLDATHGARHSLKFPFFSNGLAVAARLGGRGDLAPKIAAQFDKAIYPMFHGNAAQRWGNPGIYRGYGCDLAVLLQADMAEGN